MADSEVSVKFGADQSELTSAFSSITSSLEGLTSPITAVTESLGTLAEAFVAAFAVEKIEQFIEKMTELGESALKMSSVLGSSVEDFSSFANTLAGFGIDAETSGRSLERLERNMSQAKSGTGPAAEAFKALGISMAQVQAGSRDMPGFLDLLRQKWQETGDSTDKTAAYMALLGRGFDKLIPYFDKTTEEANAMKEAVAATGANLTTSMAKGMEETGDATNLLGLALTGVSVTLFEAFKPAIDSVVGGLTEMVESFNNALRSGQGWGAALNVLVGVVDAVVVSVAFLKLGFTGLLTTAQATFAILSAGIAGAVAALVDLGRGNLSAARADLANWGDVVKDVMKTAASDMLEAGVAYKKLVDNMANPPKPAAITKPTAQVHYDPNADKAAAQDMVSIWRQAWEQRVEASGNYLGGMKSQELAYWSDIKGQNAAGWSSIIATYPHASEAYKNAMKEQQQVDQQIYSLRKSLAQEDQADYVAHIREKQAAEKNNTQAVMADETALLSELKATYGERSRQYQDEMKHEVEITAQAKAQEVDIEKAHQKTVESIDKMKLESAKEALDEEVSMGEMSNQKKYASLMALTNQEYALELQGLQSELAVMDQSVKYYADVNNKIEVLKAQHELEMQKLTTQSADAQLQAYEKMGTAITSSFNSALQGMLSGTKTWAQEEQEIRVQLEMKVLEMIEGELVKWVAKELMRVTTTTAANTAINASNAATDSSFLSTIATQLSKWLGFETAKTSAAIAGDQAVVASDSQAGLESAAAGAASAGPVIMSDAAKAFAGVYSSVSQIPYVGWILAPIAAAGAFAAVAAMSSLASAEGGMVVGTNGQLIMGHAEEMVLPAYLTRGISNIIQAGAFQGGHGGSGGDGGDNGGGQSVYITYNFQVPDPQAASNLIKQQAPTIASVIKQAVRNGNTTLAKTMKGQS